MSSMRRAKSRIQSESKATKIPHARENNDGNGKDEFGLRDELIEDLRNFADWINKGGFPPEIGVK